MRTVAKVALSVAFLMLVAGVGTLRADWVEDGTAICTAANDQFHPYLATDGAFGAIITWTDRRTGTEDVYAQRIDASGDTVWAAGGVPICTAVNFQYHPSVISDGAGGAIIVWEDARSDPVRDIYAQRVDASGDTLWAANGVAICAVPSEQYIPTLTSDGAGGAIIVWEDKRNGAYRDVYAQRVDASGDTLWAEGGVPICTAGNHQRYPKIRSDGAGGAVIFWSDYRNNTDYDAYAQRVDASGDTLWAADGVPICTLPGDQIVDGMVTEDTGVTTVFWRDERSGSDLDIYAQRIDASGDTLWAANGAPICVEANDQWTAEAILDETGRVVVAWQDTRTGDVDVYAQRIGITGGVLWPANGVPVCTTAGDQERPFIAPDGAGGAIITWQDNRDGNLDVYTQRIDASGAPLWKIDGMPVCTAINDQNHNLTISDGAGGALVCWQDTRSGDYNIYAQRIRESGHYGVEPMIMAVMDVPADQGGKIQIRWWSCAYDSFPATDITHYSLWRRLPVAAAASELGNGEDAQMSGGRENFAGPGVYRTSNSWVWEWLANVPARYFDQYAYTAVSLSDSMGTDPGWQYFMVTAHTSVQSVFYESAIDSGYSVDNLSPCAPQGVAGDYTGIFEVTLHWNPNCESDLSHYAVYKGSTSDFVPEPGNRLGTSCDTLFVDDSFDPNEDNYYKVSAWDIHENESEFSLLRPDEITGVESPPAAPLVTRLEQNVPNPFNPVTVIRFSVAKPGWVTLVVFDVTGRPVRTLVQGRRAVDKYEVTWDGCNNAGRNVASGVYLYQLEAPGYLESKKMVLLK
jgi:hypothetical protein